ncbi:MAG: PstS family phosphate ABC transporter substrate-binding protein [Candidatus Eremiobacteraeota bacterium]|nr:PstS family phosphate ABC transporter substrate-binding protein [Candidatus Eremiobacteraeota bacterium]
MRYLSVILLVLLIISLSAGCTRQPAAVDSSPIKIDGSTMLYELSMKWAETFMKENPTITIEVLKSGTKAGIDSFLAGTCDIVETSRRLTTQEIFEARRKGVQVEESYAGFAIYTVAVNPGNPVSQLDDGQVRQIFLGKTANWKEVGGNDMPITVLYHSFGKDQYDFFLENFLDISKNIDLNNLPSHIEILDKPAETMERLRHDPGAIGYYYLYKDPKGTKAIAIAKKGSTIYRKPTLEEAIDGSYPILRPYFLYKNRSSKKPLKKFIDFIYSDKGLEITKSMNFVPVPTRNGDVDRTVLFEYN